MAPYIPGGFAAQLEDKVYSPPSYPGHIPGVAQYAPARVQGFAPGQGGNASPGGFYPAPGQGGNVAPRTDSIPGQYNPYQHSAATAQGWVPPNMSRFDSNQGSGLYLHRFLQQKISRVLFRRFPELALESGKAFSIKYDLQVGANTLTQDVMEWVGKASVLADEAFDIPLVDVSMTEDEYRVITIAAGFHYTQDQLNAAQFNGTPLRDRKMFIARRVIAEKMNSIYAYGLANNGFTGFFNNPNVPVVNSTFDAYTINTALADNLTSFFLDEVARIYSSSLMTEKPSRWIIPVMLMNQLIKIRLENQNLNVYQYILAALKQYNPGFEFIAMNEVNSAFMEANGVHAAGLNKDRLVVFPSSEEVVEAHARTVQLAPTEYRNLKFITPMTQSTTQPIWQYTTGAKYVQLPKAP